MTLRGYQLDDELQRAAEAAAYQSALMEWTTGEMWGNTTTPSYQRSGRVRFLKHIRRREGYLAQSSLASFLDLMPYTPTKKWDARFEAHLQRGLVWLPLAIQVNAELPPKVLKIPQMDQACAAFLLAHGVTHGRMQLFHVGGAPATQKYHDQLADALNLQHTQICY